MDNKFKDEMIVDESFFNTPDMGDYMSSKLLVETVGDNDLKDGENALFYVEKPFEVAPGYYPKENVFVLSGKPTWSNHPQYKYNSSLAKFDGDTLYLNFGEIVDGGKSFTVDGHIFDNIKDYIYKTNDLDTSDDEVGIRFLGLDTPETPKFRLIKDIQELGRTSVNYKLLKDENNTTINVKYDDGSSEKINSSKFHFMKYEMVNGEFSKLRTEMADNFTIDFVTVRDYSGNKQFYEAVNPLSLNSEFREELKKNNEKLICVSNEGARNDKEYHRQAQALINMVKKEIEKASEIVYVIDGTTLSSKKSNISNQYKKSYELMAENPFNFFEELWKYCTQEGSPRHAKGYRFFGKEFNGRCLGSVYLKTVGENGRGIWINLAKKVLHDYDKATPLPQYSDSVDSNSNFGFAANIFKLWTYDRSKTQYIDSLIVNGIKHDDRDDIQKAINPGFEMTAIKEHTMLFGDCLFMVPPTSIRVVNQTESTRVPLMRAKGSMVRTIPKNEKIVEIDLYFNKEDGINGIKTTWELPNGSKAIYHMNGLRALIAQFKLTPFLPITNNYVNNELGIEAVTLNSYNVTTIPNYPRTLKCTILLTEFNYRQYMPEILPPNINDGDDIYTNLFAKTIHWPVFRYYYQKIIQKGEELDSVEYNSKEYIEKTLGQRTALQKSHFKEPMINFYIANEESLKKRHQLKKQLETQPLQSKIEFSDEERAFLFNIGKMYGGIKKAINGSYPAFSPLNQLIEAKQKERTVVALTGESSKELTKIAYQDSGQMGQETAKTTNIAIMEKGTIPKISTEDIWNSKVYPAGQSVLENIFKETKNSGVVARVVPWFKTEKSEENENAHIFIGVKIEMDWQACPTVGFEEKIRKFVAKRLGLLEEDVFKNGVLYIGYSANTIGANIIGSWKDIESKFNSSSTYDTDMKMLSLMANLFGMQFDSEGVLVNEDDIEIDNFFDEIEVIGEMKDDLDIESSTSIQFDEYFAGYPIVTDMSFSYNNVLNSVSLKAVDGQASQYMGGSDTVIDINLIAKDDFTVRQLDVLPRICTRRLLDFRKIMTSSPLRIKCDIAQMMGINEVIIENVSISTVENQPDIKQISLRLVAVDRTLRNREALKKLDHDNAQGMLNTGVYTKNYFDLKGTLKHVELYPDLELPTISELSEKGFEFINYKMKEDLVFPDPDFYFVYNHLFTSNAIREALSEFFKDDENAKATREIVSSLSSSTATVTIDLSDANGPIKSEYKSDGANPSENPASIESYKENYLKLTETIVNDLKTTGYDCGAKVERDLKEALGQHKLVSELKECLEYTNYGTTTYNIINKPSVSSGRPVGIKNTLMLQDEVYYLNEKGYMVQGNPVDAIGAMNETLKYFIKEILSKPIPTTGMVGDSVVEHPEYKKFFDYLFFTIMKIDKDATFTTPGNAWDKKGHFVIEGLANDIRIKYKEAMKDLFEGLASGASGEVGRITSEMKKTDKRWKGSNKIKMNVEENGKVILKECDNIRFLVQGQGLSSIAVAKTDKEKEEGTMFGKYGIKKMSHSFLSNLYGIQLSTVESGFIDPYYNSNLSRAFLGKEIDKNTASARLSEYRKYIMTDDGEKDKASHAMFRVMLVWLYRAMSQDNQGLIPNSLYSIRRVETYVEEIKDFNEGWGKDAWDWLHNGWNTVKSSIFKDAQREKEIEKEIMDKREQVEEEAKELINGLPKAVRNQKFALFNGMWTMLGILALTEYSTPAWGAIQSGNISSFGDFLLNQKDGYIETDKVSGFSNSRVNRLLQALDYRIHDKEDQAIKYVDKLNDFKPGAIANRVYMQMAEKPSIYMLHSFYDMVMNDQRGRMARAFPTFYMLLVDEGRHIGVWKLQDNFYDVSSIVEFQVVKSRKIAADTASITMTNMFGTFTLEDEDIKDEYDYTFKDVWNSIFHVKQYYNQEHVRRSNARDINRANITPGTRVHLKAGYAGDANNLPTLFNGVVAEIQQGDLMTLVCQGNGVQLANPSMFNATDADDVADLEHNSNMLKSVWGVFSNKSTPRTILTAPLIAKGSFVQNIIKRVSKSRFFSANPFGVTAFGDREMKEIFNVDGEVCQNIFEGLNSSSWDLNKNNATSVSACYSMEEAPQIRVELQGNRSYWDLMNIAAAVSPDYISAVADFDLRSTIFHGHPRYYYAYSYVKDSQGHTVEKRKPYQQYHVFTSESDIIGNMITASQKDIRTNARGIYTGPGLITKQVKTVGPLFLDINIYPEYQQSTTINCDFEYKSSDFPLTVPIRDWYNDKFSENGGYEIAWRATANGLRETVKEMYKGELVVIGYPAIKPYDRFYVSDAYEDMQGLVETQQVVHTMSADTGFVTTITPDCISSIMDDYDKVAVAAASDALLPALGSMFAASVLTAKYINTSRAAFMSVANFIGDNSKAATDAINKIAKTLGPEDLAMAENLFPDDQVKKLRVAAGITEHDYNLQRTLHTLEEAADRIPKLRVSGDFKSRSDMMDLLDDIEGFDIDDLNPEEFNNAVDEALEKGGLSKKDRETLEGAQAYGEKLMEDYVELGANKNKTIDKKDVSTILRKAEEEIKDLANADELKKMINELNDKDLDISDKDKMKKFKTIAKNITEIDTDLDEALVNISKNILDGTDEAMESFKDAKGMLKGVKLVKAGGMMAGFMASVLPMVVTMGAEFVITKSIQDYIEKSIKNLQVLTVFPMTKNNKAWTAGLLGNQGSVYGSYSYNTEGHFQKMIGKFFVDRDDTTTGYGYVGALLRDLLLDSGAINEILDQQNNAHKESDMMLKADDATLMQKELLHQIVQSETSGASAYKQLFLVPRFSLKDEDKKVLAVAVSGDRLEGITDIEGNRRIMDELSYIFDMDACEKLRDNGVLKFSAEGNIDDNSRGSIAAVRSTFKIPGSGVEYDCKKIEREGKLPIYDIPYLRGDAVILLTTIIEKIARKIQPDFNESTCDYKELHNNNIIVHNGTRINDSSYYNTGYAFSIEVKNSDVLGNILKGMSDTQDVSKEPIFRYEKDDKLSNVYEVFVAPRK